MSAEVLGEGRIARQWSWSNMERQREEEIPVWLLSVHLNL